MKYVLDTTAFSAAMRNDPALMKVLKIQQPGNLVTAPPVVAEIYYGIERLDPSSKKCRILITEMDRWLSVIKVVPWTGEASQNFGKIKAALERSGQLIDDFDIAIAAIAKAHICGVITANLGHFKRIDDLEVEGW